MKSIVFVTGSMGRGGAERVISILSDYYVQKGWAVTILMLLNSKVGYSLSSEVEIVDLSSSSVSPVWSIPRLMREVRELVRSQKPDAVVSFMAQISLIVGMACYGLNSRLITSERIDPSMVHRNPLYKAVLHYIYANCSTTVMQTRRARDYFPEAVRKNSVIIPNPVKVYAVAAPEMAPRIVTAGRLEPQKNQAMLLDAFASVHGRHPEFRLDIYGEGSQWDALQARINALGLHHATTLKGNVADLHEQIADATMFVLPSNYEGLSNALLEAMMMGLPCISTDCAGSDEVIVSRETGLLVPVGDKSALEQAMETLITDQDFAARISAGGIESAKQYRVQNVIGQWQSVIEGEEGESYACKEHS